jgi:hypothetical protein
VTRITRARGRLLDVSAGQSPNPALTNAGAHAPEGVVAAVVDRVPGTVTWGCPQARASGRDERILVGVGAPDWPEDGPPTPEGARSGRPGPPLPDPDSVVVPDTIDELEQDIRAYHRELARRRSAGLVRHVFLTRRWVRFGLSGPVLVAVLCVVALFGSLASVFVPRSGLRPVSAPLAQPSIDPARSGGLLPDVTVTLYGDPVPIRERRPNVIALVPPQCQRCSGVLDGIYAQAKTEGLRFDIVGAPDREQELRSIDRATGNGGAVILLDEGDQLAEAYGAGVLTVLVVAPDGIVAEVLRDPQREASIGPTLERLYGASTA